MNEKLHIYELDDACFEELLSRKNFKVTQVFPPVRFIDKGGVVYEILHDPPFGLMPVEPELPLEPPEPEPTIETRGMTPQAIMDMIHDTIIDAFNGDKECQP